MLLYIGNKSVYPPIAACAWIVADERRKIKTSRLWKIFEKIISIYSVEAHGILDEVKYWVLYCDNEALSKRFNE